MPASVTYPGGVPTVVYLPWAIPLGFGPPATRSGVWHY